MKLIACQKCKDLISLVNEHTRQCFCGEIAGKYLDDNITAVVSSNAIVVGIDNYGFNLAKELSIKGRSSANRIDYFFTGWIPNHPGEVIEVETVDEVIEYDYHLPEEKKLYDSTLPTVGQE
jgi:hypothetical protein